MGPAPAGSTRAATYLRLVRTVRREAAETVVSPIVQNRSITEGWSSTSGLSSRPRDAPNAPRREVANKSALARALLGGPAAATTALAKSAASAGTLSDLNPETERRTSSETIQYVY